MRFIIAYENNLCYDNCMLDESWSPTTRERRRLEVLLSPVHAGDRLTAHKWLNQIGGDYQAPSSNVEAQELPFQRWYRFKEAFSPRFVSKIISELDKRPKFCVDPFGGSGTTALNRQIVDRS